MLFKNCKINNLGFCKNLQNFKDTNFPKRIAHTTSKDVMLFDGEVLR